LRFGYSRRMPLEATNLLVALLLRSLLLGLLLRRAR
jgi:hypothetical protein